MKKIASTIIAVGLLFPGLAWSQTPSSILPVLTGAYAPDEGGCEAAAAAFIYVEDKGIGANKTAGKVLSLKQEGSSFVLDVLWIEAGSDETDGDRDTVQIDVKDDRSFYFTNTASKRILMRWCS
ncbi:MULTISPECIES: hypothetical protein [unclassified Ensifer]|uniref:hypothetical protein n=1 Tax=Ensifer TaxID=106591 RepID=UPI000711142D|nr:MULTISPECIES: hypothetical protein [unclassified Ensifer]KQW61144.1 hypothetical protein ASD02_23760 [Ensifer sp. Root1252]KRC78050.1 hypothetical protein ASE32_28370 [Ensifer sp. Root231]KRD00471.1 hypothetical protein ASE47_24340 [Ensifer sp. Root258]